MVCVPLFGVSVNSVGDFRPGMWSVRVPCLRVPLTLAGGFLRGWTVLCPLVGFPLFRQAFFLRGRSVWVSRLRFFESSEAFFPPGMDRVCPLVGVSVNRLARSRLKNKRTTDGRNEGEAGRVQPPPPAPPSPGLLSVRTRPVTFGVPIQAAISQGPTST